MSGVALRSGAASDAGTAVDRTRERPIENEPASNPIEKKQGQQQQQQVVSTQVQEQKVEFVYSEENVKNAQIPASASALKEVRQVASEIATNVFRAASEGKLDDVLSEFVADRAREQMNLEKNFNEIIHRGNSDAYFHAIADGARVAESFRRSLDPRDPNANNELYQYLTEKTNEHVRPISSVLADNALKELDSWYNYDKELAREMGRVMEVLNGDSMSRLLVSIEVPKDTMIVQITPNLYTRLVELLLGITANMTVPMRRFLGFVSEAYKLTSHYVPFFTDEAIAILNPKMAELSQEERAKLLKDSQKLAENKEISDAAMSIVSPLGIFETYFLPDSIGHVETLNPVELRFMQASLKADIVLRRAVELIGNVDTTSLHSGDDQELSKPPDSTNPLGQRNMEDLMTDAFQAVEKEKKTATPLKGNYSFERTTEPTPVKSGARFKTLQDKRVAAKLDKLPAAMRTMAASFAEAARQSLDGDYIDDKNASDQAEGQLPFISKLSKTILNKILDGEKDSIGSRCIDAIQEQIKETNAKSALASLVAESAEFHRTVVQQVMDTVEYHQPSDAYKKENTQGTLDVLDMLVSSVLNSDDNVISGRMSDAEKRQVRDHVAHHLKIRKKARRIVIVRSTAAQISLGSDPLRHDENDEDEVMSSIDQLLSQEEPELSPRAPGTKLRPDQPLRHIKKRPYQTSFSSVDEESDVIDDSDDAPIADSIIDDAFDFSFNQYDGDNMDARDEQDDAAMFDAPSIRQVTSSPTTSQTSPVKYRSPFKKARIMNSDDLGTPFSEGRLTKTQKKPQTKRTRSINDNDEEVESDHGKTTQRARRGNKTRGAERTSAEKSRVTKKQTVVREERTITRRSIRGGFHGAVARERASQRAKDLATDKALKAANVPIVGKASEEVATAIKTAKTKISKQQGKELKPEEAQRAFEDLRWSDQYLEQLKAMNMTTYDSLAILGILTTLGAGVVTLLNYTVTDKNAEATAADTLSISLLNTLEKRTALTNDHFSFADALFRGANSVAATGGNALRTFNEVQGQVLGKAASFLTTYEGRQVQLAKFFKEGRDSIENIIEVSENIMEQSKRDMMRYQAAGTMINLLSRGVAARLVSPDERTIKSIEGSANDMSITADQINIARTTPLVPTVPNLESTDLDYAVNSLKYYHDNASPNTPSWMLSATQNVIKAMNDRKLSIKENPAMVMSIMQQAALDGFHEGMDVVPILGVMADQAAEVQIKASERIKDAARLTSGEKLKLFDRSQKILDADQMEQYMRAIGTRLQEMRGVLELTPESFASYQEVNQKAMDELTRQIKDNIDTTTDAGQKIIRDVDELRKGLDKTNRYIKLQINLVDTSIRENILAMDKYFHVVWLNYRKSVFDSEPIQRDYKSMGITRLKEDGASAAAILAAGNTGMTWSSMNFVRQGFSMALDRLDKLFDLNKAYEDFSRVKNRIDLYRNDDFSSHTKDPNNASCISQMIKEGWIYKRAPGAEPLTPNDFTLEAICEYDIIGGLEALKKHGEALQREGKELTIGEAEAYHDKYLTHMTALQSACADMHAAQSDALYNEAIAAGKDQRTIENLRRLRDGAVSVATKLKEHHNIMIANKSLGVIMIDGSTSLLRFLNTTRFGASAMKNIAQIGMLALFTANVAFQSFITWLRSKNSNDASSGNGRVEALLKKRKRANATTVIVNGKTTRLSMPNIIATILETGFYGIHTVLMTLCKDLYDSGRFLEDVLKQLPEIATIAPEVREAAAKGGQAWEEFKASRTKSGNIFSRTGRGLSLEFYRGMSLGIDAIGSIIGNFSASMIYQIDRIYQSHSPGLKEHGFWSAFWNKILKKDYALKLAIPGYLAYKAYEYIDTINSGIKVLTFTGSMASYVTPDAVKLGATFAGALVLGGSIYFMHKFLNWNSAVTGRLASHFRNALVSINNILNRIDEAMPGFKYYVGIPALIGITCLGAGCMGMFTSLALFAARQCLNIALSTAIRSMGDFLINQIMKLISGNSKFKGSEADMKTLAPSSQVLYVVLKLLSSYGTRYASMQLNHYTNLKFLYTTKGIQGTTDGDVPTPPPETEMVDRMNVDTEGVQSAPYPLIPTTDTFKPLVSERDVAEIITNTDSTTFDPAEANKLMADAKRNLEPYGEWIDKYMGIFSDLLRFTSGTSIGLDNAK